MAGTRGGVGRIVAMVVALAIGLVLLFVGAARGARYTVLQCHAGIAVDADWWDSTGGEKFAPAALCGSGGEGDHLLSGTRGGGTVTGSRFARWRWLAPPTTYLTRVTGAWWHVLHDGFQQRIGAINWAGGFEPLLAADAPDTPQRFFVLDFPVPVAGLEDRLLCARTEDRWCSLAEPSWAADRLLTFELEDERAPTAAIGGDLTASGWRRGALTAGVRGSDAGSGVRFGDTWIDGARVARTEYPCDAGIAGGALVGRRMQPCLTLVDQGQTIDTAALADGPHQLAHCVSDFAGNVGCSDPRSLLVDNHPPAPPLGLGVDGGGGWHDSKVFAVSWRNPDQGPASPIVGATWRLTGADGYDRGVDFTRGDGLAALNPIVVPDEGEYTLRVWLRDEAGNEAEANAATATLRYDAADPDVAFVGGADDAIPPRVEATVSDGLSGPARGAISFRRAAGDPWVELPTHLEPGPGGRAGLSAPTPAIAPGTVAYFRAEGADAAGNSTTSTQRADGSPMALRRPAGAEGVKGGGVGKPGRRGDAGGDGKAGGRGARGERGERGDGGGNGSRGSNGGTRLRAWLRPPGEKGHATSLTVPFGSAAVLAGRLEPGSGANPAAAAGKRLRVAIRPARGSRLPARTVSVVTGRGGSFSLRLPPGPSRRLAVSVAAAAGGRAERRELELRVRAGVTLTAPDRHLANGEVLRLSGQIATGEATIPRPGKLVTISYLERAAHRWRPVLVTRSDRAGRFETAYRFRYVSGVAKVRLRATAPAEARWPYAPGSSSPLTVEVDG